MADGFEPKIIGFLCNWCSYGGADLAGVSRFQYPPNIRVVRVMCSGRIHPSFVFKALLHGADGVLVGGCHPGDCHYVKGNYYTERRIRIMRRLLEWLGIERERLWVRWISAGEGSRFASTVTEYTAFLRELGPNTRRVADADYEDLARVASAMGSVGRLVLEEDVCMVELAKYFLEYTQRESCAECIPCRIGTKRLLEVLERVVQGEAAENEFALLEEVGAAIGRSAKCDLGRIAGRAVADVAKYGRDELKAHLQGTCLATVEANRDWQALVGSL
ncbi:MAG: hydrogenase iron-sulfur subunit [Desulforudis sp.]|nr:MAG: hydrogenase iron-sulfur subunit [Desulforudis sp.]